LVAQINEIGQKEGRERDKKLKELLAKSFPVIRVKSLRPVVMCILRNTPHIEDKYLKILVISCFNIKLVEYSGYIWYGKGPNYGTT
jgi:hypothetical protein